MNKTILKNQSHNKKINASKAIVSLMFALGVLLMIALPAAASDETQYEDVFINGYKLGFFEQMALEDHIDRDIPDGNYWFEMSTGMWGPVGGTAIGHIEVPDDYRDYVKSKFANPTQPTKVEMSASVTEECDYNCMY